MNQQQQVPVAQPPVAQYQQFTQPPQTAPNQFPPPRMHQYLAQVMEQQSQIPDLPQIHGDELVANNKHRFR